MNAAEAAKILDARVEGDGPFCVDCPVCSKPSLVIYDVGTGVAEMMCGSGCKDEAIKAAIDKAKGIKPKPNMDWTQQFTITDEEADAMNNPDWIYTNVIIRGHLIAIPAPPGGGKTTIMQYISGQICKDYRVYYVNADISGGDAKWAHAHAKKHGYTLMLPDMNPGLSMGDVVERLILMNEIDADYSDDVFIFDTLKKMTNVISKKDARTLYSTLRGLTAKGMTIPLLCHTNKYKDADGNPIYEGTGDLRSDVDDLIYLVPRKNEDGSMTVSTDIISETSKTRGSFEQVTFEISPDRVVTQLDEFVDVAYQTKVESQREKDTTVIEAITEAIEAGNIHQTEIITYCSEKEIAGRRVVEAVLHRYQYQPEILWTAEKGFQKNAVIYTLK